MTHLSWDVFGCCVLERRRFVRPGRAGLALDVALGDNENEPPFPLSPRFGRADPGSSHFAQQFRRFGAIAEPKSEFKPGSGGLREPLAGTIGVPGPGSERVTGSLTRPGRQRIARGNAEPGPGGQRLPLTEPNRSAGGQHRPGTVRRSRQDR